MLFPVPAKIIFPQSILFSFLQKVDHVSDQFCKKPIERRIVTSRYHGNKISGIGVCILGEKKKYALVFCS